MRKVSLFIMSGLIVFSGIGNASCDDPLVCKDRNQKITYEMAMKSDRAWRDQYKEQSITNEESREKWLKYNQDPPPISADASSPQWVEVWSQPASAPRSHVVEIPKGVMKNGYFYAMVMEDPTNGAVVTGSNIYVANDCWKSTRRKSCSGAISDDDTWGIYTKNGKVVIDAGGIDGINNGRITSLYEYGPN